jgi:hypothetical protein
MLQGGAALQRCDESSTKESGFSRRGAFLSAEYFPALLALVLTASAAAVTKPHVITFGKWTPVQWTAAINADEKPLPLKVRSLMVDARVKEYVTGPPHEITERLFVVRRMFRVNDSLPDDHPAMAMAARRLAAGRSPHRTNLPHQPPGI